MLTYYTNDVPWRSTGKAGVNRWLTHDEVSTWDVVYTPDDSGVL